MPFSSLIADYIGVGLAAARPVTPNVGTAVGARYFSTDTVVDSVWDGTAWVDFSASGPVTVEDEGTPITTALTSLDFVGSGVTATNSGGAVTITVPGGGGGASVWSLFSSTTIAAPVANVDVTGLVGATDIMVLVRDVTLSVSGTRNIQVSVDNGATFFSTSGNYLSVPTAGNPAATTSVPVHTTGNVAARSGVAIITAANVVSTTRPIEVLATGTLHFFEGSTADIDAIRVIGSGGGNLTAGRIDVFIR